MAAENIDNTVNGSGLFNAKVPGLSDAADIQAALRLYHYGSYTYDGANTNPANLVNPSIANHLQNLKTGKISFSYATINDFPAASANGGYIAHAISTGKLYFAHAGAWIPLADQSYVLDQILNSAVDQAGLAGEGIVWNAADSQFDLQGSIINNNKVIKRIMQP